MSVVSFHVPGVPAPQGSKVRTRFGMRAALDLLDIEGSAA